MKRLFYNWQRKIISFFGAVVIWYLVSSSISTTKSFEKIPVRINNVPLGKAVCAGTSEGYLDKRADVTLTGSKDVLTPLSAQDFEIVIDAANKGDEWIARITPNNLSPTRPDLHLSDQIREVSGSDIIVRLSPLVMTKIPIFIRNPRGAPPDGYQFIDVFPRKVYHTVNVPQEDAQRLEKEGLEITFDISKVTAEEINAIRVTNGASDEVSFQVPEEWKKIRLPNSSNSPQVINGSEARNLRLDFLFKSFIAYKGALPVSIFYPKSVLPTYGPETLRLRANNLIYSDQGLFFFAKQIFVSGVSSLFLNTVKDRMEIVIIPTIRNGELYCTYGIQFVDPAQLEEAFVTVALSGSIDAESSPPLIQTVRQQFLEQEKTFRMRFREYMHNCTLYLDKNLPLSLSIKSDGMGNLEIQESVR